MPSVESLDSTEGEEYTDRLKRLEQPLWKRVLDVQAPYRWNLRRLFGDREVLEVGCGIGRCLGHLAPRGVGVDHNAHSVAECRRRGLTAFTVDEFAASEYATPGRFAGMLAAHLVEHLPRAEAGQLGFTRTTSLSFPLPRRAGRYFRYNEFNLVADRQA